MGRNIRVGFSLIFSVVPLILLLGGVFQFSVSGAERSNPPADLNLGIALGLPTGATPTPACTPIPPRDEGFTDITNLVPAGWFMQNNSQPGPGTTGWFQGSTIVFPAHSGAANSYIAADFHNGTDTSTLSNWLLTPMMLLYDGVQLTFWTRTVDAPEFPDRLQVRISGMGASTNVGTTATDVGDFQTLLLDINPTYSATGYPDVWTQYTITLNGIGIVSGRIAFRYFVENGGPNGANSDYIGIDTLHIAFPCVPASTATPTPTPITTPGTPSPTPTAGTPTPTPGPPTPTPCIQTEGFDDITTLIPADWFMQNNSQPGPGKTGWFQGNDTVFPSQSGAPTSYIAANFDNGTDTSTLSNWLLTPSFTLQNGVQLTFWTRTVDTPSFPDRLQVRMSTNGASTNVGTTATSVGDFTTLLLDINPTYTTTGYPNAWTQFTITLSGIPSPVHGRLAFRYFVENGGPNGSNSDYIGIDTFAVSLLCGPTPTPGPPTPTPTVSPSPSASPSPTVSPSPGPAASFRVSTPVKWEVDTPLSFGVQALDQFGNPTPLYSGTIHFTSTDPGAELPADSTLTNGAGTFIATLHTLGSWTITATDTVAAQITGTSSPIIVIGPQPTPTATPTATATITPSLSPTPTATPSSGTQPLNLSTRLLVQAGDDTGIGGFILTGTTSTNLLFRGIGPSLGGAGVPNALPNPTLDLRDGNGTQLLANDNWRDTQEAAIIATGIPPTNDLESAIVANLNPGSYTVVLRGSGTPTGVGLIEIYNLDRVPTSKLANLATRAFVSTGNDVVIAGFILDGNNDDQIVARGIGPSLTAAGVPNALPDPTLELRDSQGTLLIGNNNWHDDAGQAAQITAANLALTNDLESGVFATLSPGPYTAILAGQNNGVGVGLVEIYDLGPP